MKFLAYISSFFELKIGRKNLQNNKMGQIQHKCIKHRKSEDFRCFAVRKNRSFRLREKFPRRIWDRC